MHKGMHVRVLLHNGILSSWAHSGDGDDGDRMGEMGGNKEFDVEGVSSAAVCLLLIIGI
jgi:hypothetical protein